MTHSESLRKCLLTDDDVSFISRRAVILSTELQKLRFFIVSYAAVICVVMQSFPA